MHWALDPPLTGPTPPQAPDGLCNGGVPITGQLFGDNLTTSIIEVKELDI